MKKIMIAIISILLFANLGTYVFADATGSVTVKGMTEGETYDLYRIFDLDYTVSGTNTKVRYTITSAWKDFFKSGAAGAGYIVDADTDPASLNRIVVDGAEKYINITSSNVAKFAQDALGYAAKKTSDKTYTATSSDTTSYTFKDLPLGYYLMYPQGATEKNSSTGSVCSLDSTIPNCEISIKATYPTITKQVSDTNGVELGETITYTISGTIADTTGYDSYLWSVSDTMGSGVTFDDTSLKISIDGTDTAYATVTTAPTKADDFSSNAIQYIVNSAKSGFDLYFDMTKQSSNVGKDVVITYTATVNSVEVTSNSAVLKYSNDPADPFSKTKSTSAQIVTIWSNTVKVNKYDGSKTDKSEKLAGAEFVLYKKSGDTKSYYKLEKNTVSWVSSIDNATKIKTDSKGEASFTGIENGDYYLYETASPSGYNELTKSANDIKVTVNGSKTACDTKTADIANFTGAELPSTGGIGTTLFYIVGGVLTVGAVVLYITKKRIIK